MNKLMSRPNYRRIYSDIISIKYPDKKEFCENILIKKYLSSMDIMEINKRIFGKVYSYNLNQRHKSYTKNDILTILNYQKSNNLNNSQLANHFNLSRNTIAKWRKLFQV